MQLGKFGVSVVSQNLGIIAVYFGITEGAGRRYFSSFQSTEFYILCIILCRNDGGVQPEKNFVGGGKQPGFDPACSRQNVTAHFDSIIV